MQELQYFHNKGDNYFTSRKHTFAFIPPDPQKLFEDVELMLSNEFGVKITFPFGATVVSPEDNYNKKIGRVLAKERMTDTDFVIHSFDFTAEKNLIVTLLGDKYSFRLGANRNKPYTRVYTVEENS